MAYGTPPATEYIYCMIKAGRIYAFRPDKTKVLVRLSWLMVDGYQSWFFNVPLLNIVTQEFN